MRKILLASIIVFVTATSYSQVQQVWALSHIAELHDQVVDANGNVYQTGEAYSEAQSTEGYLTIKHDKNGNELWRHFSPGLRKNSYIAVDASGNVYIAGATGNFSNIVSNDTHFYLSKLNANGVFQWSNIYLENENSLPHETYGHPNGLAIDANGNPYVTGVLFSAFIPTNFQGPPIHPDSSTADYATIKYDAATGNRVWVKRYNGATPGEGYDDAKGIAVDAFGYIYVTGTSQLNGFRDIATIKYDPAGNELWVQRYSNPDAGLKNDYSRGIKLDPAGNVIVGGLSKAGEDVNDSGGGKRFIVKYIFSGLQLWVRERIFPFSGHGVFGVDNNNNIIDGSDANMVKYSAAGDLVWEKDDFPNASKLVIDGDNNIYIVGTCLDVDLCGSRYGITTKKINSNGVELWEKTYPWFASYGVWIGIDADKNIYSSGSESAISSVRYISSGYVTIRYSQCEINIASSIRISTDPGLCGAQVSEAATSTGDCGEIIYRNITGTYTYSLDSFYSAGHYHIEAYSPSTGATKRFTIYVEDHEFPVMTYCPPSKTLNTDPGVCYVTAANANVGIATATDNCTLTVKGVRSDGEKLDANYPGGVTTITWTAKDASGNTSECTQTITVVDNQPPVITGESASTYVLSPPNHTMRDVTINYNTPTDNCSVTWGIAVTSNEPVNGTGDGDTDPDWIVIDDHHVKLRAERAANGSGRTYTITITATDGAGNIAVKTVEVKVPHNIKNPHSGRAFIVGSTISFEGEFWDKPGNRHTAKWLIDGTAVANGTVTEPSGNQNGKVTGSYKFNAAGVYKLQMNVTDQNGIINYANTNGDLDAIVVVYDPNGANAFGGGWFSSQAGALKNSPLATGKASYGFAVNYRNAAKPKGETQFEFKVGTFEFNALNFEYLAVSNSKAQFKGTGKIIGGQSGVAFTMTVTDGALDGTGIDKIRMKIYNKNTGAIIYDNQPGASDADNPVAAVGANSVIVIQGNQSNSSMTKAVAVEVPENITADGLEITANPNPSNSYFSVKVRTNNIKEKIVLQVYDVNGKMLDVRNSVSPGSSVRFGDLYRPGTYFVRVIQGKEHKELKLIKIIE